MGGLNRPKCLCSKHLRQQINVFCACIGGGVWYNGGMKNKKHIVSYDALQTASETAKNQNLRIGQLVVNTLLPAHGHTNPEALLELFNCEDKDFWKKATLALDIR